MTLVLIHLLPSRNTISAAWYMHRILFHTKLLLKVDSGLQSLLHTRRRRPFPIQMEIETGETTKRWHLALPLAAQRRRGWIDFTGIKLCLHYQRC